MGVTQQESNQEPNNAWRRYMVTNAARYSVSLIILSTTNDITAVQKHEGQHDTTDESNEHDILDDFSGDSEEKAKGQRPQANADT